MDQNLSQPKWNAKFSTRLSKARANQIWPLFQDFFGVHKWFPGLPTSHGIHGANGEPGCIRYCSGFGLKREENNHESRSSNSSAWSKERLITIDHDQMTFTYEMVDSNIGFKSYVSTIKVVPADEGGDGCTVEWCISLDPVAGWKLADLVVKYEAGLQLMVKKMEDAIFGAS